MIDSVICAPTRHRAYTNRADTAAPDAVQRLLLECNYVEEHDRVADRVDQHRIAQVVHIVAVRRVRAERRVQLRVRLIREAEVER